MKDHELVWLRTCQECGHKQKGKEPNRDKELSNAYRNAKCRKCGSESLDYGSFKQVLIK
jgi:DNA-directed RNA polymerase subunit RPC12/RpoP